MKEPSKRHIEKTISSTVQIKSKAESVWENITNVQLEQFSDPWYFKLLNIPKPLKAEVTRNGVGGSRIAFFNNGKKFIQTIDTWEELKEYSFSFNPEKNFVVGFFFDLSDGIFKILTGSYYLRITTNGISLELKTTYSISRNANWILSGPIRIVLYVFQEYLLKSIKKNSELHSIEIN
jgi:hypothetical protein